MDKIPLMHCVLEVSLSEINEFIDDHLEKNKKYQGFEINFQGRRENIIFWSQPESSAYFELDKKLIYQSFHDYYFRVTDKIEVKISYEFHPMLRFIYDSLEDKIYKTYKVLDIPLFLERDTSKDLYQDYLNKEIYFYNAFCHEKNFDIQDPINLKKIIGSESNKRKGRKSEFTSDEQYEAVIAYRNIPKNAGITLDKFLEVRFGLAEDGNLKVPVSTFYTWQSNFLKKK